MPTADAVREDTQLSHWQERLRRVLGAVRVTTADGTSPGGTVVTARLGHVDVSRVESDAQRVARTARAPRHGEAPDVLLALLRGGTMALVQDEGHVVADQGDLLVWDEARPYSLHCGGPFTALVLRVPRSRLGLSDDSTRSVALSAFASSAGTAGLLGTVVSTLATSPASYAPSVAGRLADSVVDLLSILLLERSRPGDHGAGERAALVRRVREHIDRNLQDPALSPRTVARDHHISVRYLHRVFQPEDTTVGRLIQQRRIEQSARELARHELRTLSVAAVALRWGFANPAHFSRVFRRRYGCTPVEWRRSGSRA
ncbi:helix-turn-helix domain-containing protein [Streptomyces sp. NPDC093071]|uniref:helix-turn-helix domain-containing protein n=1 Tax=Streptomyces sp. NPDC093071 TaxID=3366022 RepID=UPI0037F16FB3